ncbi:helix-turn-helix domain-containing protein [Brevibacillus choshinensis]|uniref:helix-turn-helix domain-containing protein n=1 Tax=Brevibacillus choshinensis TaxID=54911 RepID=UPI002E1D7A8D|nr:helix-turn-helix domain-containing protein [Brevibacillus choshinensis]MED4751108.1 helix-turn-helix domain-containing protein [Brevibacillus choshinensis]MED4783238.1 helix-turn-helix domain-containing protein [Brevibacillus choshinensis]
MNNRSITAQDVNCAVALNALIPLASERTLQAAFYILRGRKANQTLQDVHLYNLYPYYRMFPRFSKEDWDKIVSTLLQNGLIEHLEVTATNGKPSFTVTEKGREQAKEWRSRYLLDQWLAPFTDSGMAERVELFWHRLHLVVQTISQLLAEDMGFMPVVSDKKIQQWVKAQVSSPMDRSQWKQQLGEELYLLWSPLPQEVQTLLVGQLSGAAQVGKTLSQLSMQQNESTTYLLLTFRYGLAQSIQRLQAEAESFPYLSRLVFQKDKLDQRLTESAARTYSLIQRGLGIKQIASTRKVKESTVEDHLAEIALRCPEWDYTAYLDPELGDRIVQTSELLHTSRLRLIKDQLGADVSYLQIRLALARRQGESGI